MRPDPAAQERQHHPGTSPLPPQETFWEVREKKNHPLSLRAIFFLQVNDVPFPSVSPKNLRDNCE